MATLYVENVPNALYKALKKRAKENHRSIAAEVRLLLEENVPTAKELNRRVAFYRKVLRAQNRKPLTPGPFPATEEMVREARGL